jgi:hypothetical protein
MSTDSSTETWKAEEAAGLMDSTKWPRLNYTKCVDGVAAAVPGDPLLTFRCKNVSLPLTLSIELAAD